MTERELIADYPDDDMGEFPMHHVVPRLSGTPASIRTRAPHLGEHNRALLKEIGVDDAVYEKLIAGGIAFEGTPAKAAEEE
jgi:crotonobetainyl-CoA:carnitine CoA-transferase CaiB-like acyl-CoA transferase